MAFFLDTNIIIHAVGGLEQVLEKLLINEGAVVTSALVLAELQRGFFKRSSLTLSRKTGFDTLMLNIPVLAFDAAAAEAYGRIIAQCGWVKGRDFDRMIAAHAISSASVLVTNNAADFRDVPGLLVENWV